jgi:hypothetical protein
MSLRTDCVYGAQENIENMQKAPAKLRLGIL